MSTLSIKELFSARSEYAVNMHASYRADNLFTGSQATPKTKNEVAAMCSDYEPPGNEYCVVTPNSFSLGASDKFALAKVGPAPQCLIINPNDNDMSIKFSLFARNTVC